MSTHRIMVTAVVMALAVSVLPIDPAVLRARAQTSPAKTELDRLEAAQTPVMLNFKQTEVRILIEALGAASGVEFRIVGDLSGKRVDIELPKTSLAEALERLASAAGLSYRVIDARTVEVLPILVAGADGVTVPVLIQDSRVTPSYPKAAREQRLGGRVILQAAIDRTGVVGDIEVLKSEPAGFQPFIDSAMAAVRQWRYEPATRDGEPVAVHFTIVVGFSIGDDTPPATL